MTLLAVVGFNVVMLALLEIPLLGFTIAADWTLGAINGARASIG